MARLFAHRGFHQGNIPQNSIASLNSAYENKFRAIEFDIWFLEGKLILKHDQPHQGEKLDFFYDYLRFGSEMTYWLDFKNLNERNAREIFILVKAEIEKSKINLSQFYFAPFITDYEIAKKVLQKAREAFGEDIQFAAVCEKEENILAVKFFLKENHVKALSIFYQLLDNNFLKKFPDLEIFAWTVNDLKSLQELEAIGIKNFATDKITPQIYGEKT